MKFSTREDVDAPIDPVFDSLCAFEAFERQAIRRGAEVRRTDAMTAPGVGMTWDVSFPVRGKVRKFDLLMRRFEKPHFMGVDASSDGLESKFDVEVIALSRTRTRVAVSLELKPKTLAARLFLQSLRLAKASLTKRFKLRIAEQMRGLEERLRKSA